MSRNNQEIPDSDVRLPSILGLNPPRLAMVRGNNEEH